MNKKLLRFLQLALLVSLVSCGSADRNDLVFKGSVTGNTYTWEEGGWTIEIPSGWTIMSKDKIEQIVSRGVKAIKKAGEKAIKKATKQSENESVEYLVSFQKDKDNVNRFLSESQALGVKSKGEWEDRLDSDKRLMLETFRKNGIKTEAGDTETVKIDGVDFKTFQLKLHGPAGSGTERLYYSLIKGCEVVISMTYNNDADRDVMVGVLQNSKFKK